MNAKKDLEKEKQKEKKERKKMKRRESRFFVLFCFCFCFFLQKNSIFSSQVAPLQFDTRFSKATLIHRQHQRPQLYMNYDHETCECDLSTSCRNSILNCTILCSFKWMIKVRKRLQNRDRLMIQLQKIHEIRKNECR